MIKAVDVPGRTWDVLRCLLQDTAARSDIEALRPPAAAAVSLLRKLDVALWVSHSDTSAARRMRHSVRLLRDSDVRDVRPSSDDALIVQLPQRALTVAGDQRSRPGAVLARPLGRPQYWWRPRVQTSPDAGTGQAKSYAYWLKPAYYVTTNGDAIVVTTTRAASSLT